jgi:hypothetical protein
MTAIGPVSESLLNKDFSKLRNFFVQAVTGPYMSLYRRTGALPRNSNALTYIFATYLNNTHMEVVTGSENDEYIRLTFEDCLSHHSINCIVNVIFHLGSIMLQHLASLDLIFPDSLTEEEKINGIRSMITDIVDSRTPDFSAVFDHTCSGQSIHEIKAEVQDGTYTPPFVFSNTPI